MSTIEKSKKPPVVCPHKASDTHKDSIMQGFYGEDPLHTDVEADIEFRGLFSSRPRKKTTGTNEH